MVLRSSSYMGHVYSEYSCKLFQILRNWIPQSVSQILPKVFVIVSFITSIEHFCWFRFTKCGFKYSDNHIFTCELTLKLPQINGSKLSPHKSHMVLNSRSLFSLYAETLFNIKLLIYDTLQAYCNKSGICCILSLFNPSFISRSFPTITSSVAVTLCEFNSPIIFKTSAKYTTLKTRCYVSHGKDIK